jgi:hypothetical protein
VTGERSRVCHICGAANAPPESRDGVTKCARCRVRDRTPEDGGRVRKRSALSAKLMPIALVGMLILPAAAQAMDSWMAENAALRADYAYAVDYLGTKPDCKELRVLTSNFFWQPNELGHTTRLPGFCEVEIKWGIGRCRRRLTMLHEFGHLLRLRFNPHPKEQPEHSLDPHSVMFPAMEVVWAEHPELCPWTTPPPLPSFLDQWIEAEEEWS